MEQIVFHLLMVKKFITLKEKDSEIMFREHFKRLASR